MTDKPTQNSIKDSQSPPEKNSGMPANPKRDGWDKFEILTRPMAAFLTAIIIAIISFFGQRTITAISLQEQNARLYTELLARREDAESSLRKDMFNQLVGTGQNKFIPAHNRTPE